MAYSAADFAGLVEEFTAPNSIGEFGTTFAENFERMLAAVSGRCYLLHWKPSKPGSRWSAAGQIFFPAWAANLCLMSGLAVRHRLSLVAHANHSTDSGRPSAHTKTPPQTVAATAFALYFGTVKVALWLRSYRTERLAWARWSPLITRIGGDFALNVRHSQA
jgi:hypothetical protein